MNNISVYITPKAEILELEIENNILSGSGIGNSAGGEGGEVQPF